MRNDAIITELLFEHSLRIRVKYEASENRDKPHSGDGTGDGSDKQSNFVGRLNNLVTSDLENVREGNYVWMQLCEECF